MAEFGVQIFPTDQTIQPIPLAKAVEERGLDSLFFPEHTHIPTARTTPFPGGTDLPEWYWRTHGYASTTLEGQCPQGMVSFALSGYAYVRERTTNQAPVPRPLWPMESVGSFDPLEIFERQILPSY